MPGTYRACSINATLVNSAYRAGLAAFAYGACLCMQHQCSVDVLGYSAAGNALELCVLILPANAITVTVKPAADFSLGFTP